MKEEAERRAIVQEAMLVACGDLGYREVTVRDVLERSGVSRVRFFELFDGKADCYARAHRAEMERLCEAMLGAAAAGSWCKGLRAALSEMAAFLRERPLLAKGLLVEARVAGGAAIATRTEMIERLSRAIDSARRETGSRHSPPPITAEFMVGAIEEAVVRALARNAPAEFAEVASELVFFTVAPYFGEERAKEERAALEIT